MGPEGGVLDDLGLPESSSTLGQLRGLTARHCRSRQPKCAVEAVDCSVERVCGVVSGECRRVGGRGWMRTVRGVPTVRDNSRGQSMQW